MNNRKLILFFFLTTLPLLAQNKSKLKAIITLKGKDTFEIRRYDDQQHLIFEKHYSQHGISQILAYTYQDNTLTHSVWSHSHSGFLISDYTYDAAANSRTAYSYESQGNIENLMAYSSFDELKQDTAYVQAYQKEKGFLKEVVYYKDTLITKKIQYTATGDTLDIEEYSYEQNRLKSIKQTLHNRKAINERVIEYDAHGNETQWMKIFAGKDTANVMKKTYHHNKLVEEQLFSKYLLESTTHYSYSGALLKSKKQYDAQHVLKMEEVYAYDKSKRLLTITKTNNYMNLHTVVYYKYE